MKLKFSNYNLSFAIPLWSRKANLTPFIFVITNSNAQLHNFIKAVENSKNKIFLTFFIIFYFRMLQKF